MEKFEFKKIERAIASALQEFTYFPRVSQILKILEKENDSKKFQGIEAWSELLESLKNSSEGKNEITQAVVKVMGGARHLAMMNFRDLEFKQKQFLELYQEKNTQSEISSENLIEFKNTGVTTND